MAHLLAEFSPRHEGIDVAAQVPALIRAAASLGLHCDVQIVAVESTHKMQRPSAWAAPEVIGAREAR